MAEPPTTRPVVLADAGRPGVAVPATLVRDLPADRLAAVEAVWRPAREELEAKLIATGRVDEVQHAHWNWTNKIDAVDAGRYRLVGVECGGDVQGLMAVRPAPYPSRADPAGGLAVLYVDYLETAPWNLRTAVGGPRYKGVGGLLVAEAVRISGEVGSAGRVGLHSLPQAERFYAGVCGMTRVGPDPDYYDLCYFEFAADQAARWLDRVGETT
jgi:hypothetical protein